MGRATDSALARPHVLVVSDDADLRTFLTEGLLYAGFWTSGVASAIQTLEVFRLRSFDLVLIDAALAGLGATELVRRLRDPTSRAASRQPRTDVPILLVTDDPSAVDDEAATLLGVDEVLVAPLDLESIALRLFDIVAAWRLAHPDRPWADAAAQAPRDAE
jgi:DNA-binding response OmpR family regulator